METDDPTWKKSTALIFSPTFTLPTTDVRLPQRTTFRNDRELPKFSYENKLNFSPIRVSARTDVIMPNRAVAPKE
jgi:hypothetical protein